LALPEETPLLSAGIIGLVLHIHTAKEEVQIKKIKGRCEKDGTVNKKINILSSNQEGICVLKTTRVLCCEKYAEYGKLGHFTIRDQ